MSGGDGWGYHWTPCSGGGGGRRGGIGAGAVVALVFFVVVVTNAKAIETGLIDLLEIALAAVAGVAVVGGGTAVAVWRVRRRRALAAASRPVLTAVPVRPGVPGRTAAPITHRDVPALPQSHIDAPAPVVTGRTVRPRCTQRRPNRR